MKLFAFILILAAVLTTVLAVEVQQVFAAAHALLVAKGQ